MIPFFHKKWNIFFLHAMSLTTSGQVSQAHLITTQSRFHKRFLINKSKLLGKSALSAFLGHSHAHTTTPHKH